MSDITQTGASGSQTPDPTRKGNHEFKKKHPRTKRHLFALIFGFSVLIPVLLVCMMELTARKQVMDDIQREISLVRGKLIQSQSITATQRELTARSADATTQTLVTAMDLSREEAFQSEQTKLHNLIMIGSSEPSQTVYAILRRVEARKDEFNNTDRNKVLLLSEISAAEEELAFIRAQQNDLQRLRDDVSRFAAAIEISSDSLGSSKTSAIRRLVEYSAALGTVEQSHQAGTALRNFDISLIELVRLVDPNSDGSRPLTSEDLERLVSNADEALMVFADTTKTLRTLIKSRQEALDSTLAKEIPTTLGAADQPDESPTYLADLLKSDLPNAGIFPSWMQFVFTYWLTPITSMSNSMLFSVSVVLGGAVGSLFAGCYFGLPDAFSRVFLGAIAGLIALLVLKGGKFLFIIEVGNQTTDNPFAGAFAGILAGLFTDRLFSLVEHLVDTSIHKVENGTGKKPDENAAPDAAIVPGDGDDDGDGDGDKSKGSPPNNRYEKTPGPSA